MFDKEVYTKRREILQNAMSGGIVLFLGNEEVSMNYADNTYRFRQDSSFLYYFGLDAPGLAAVIDVDENRHIIFGNDVDMEDVIWMGPQQALQDRAKEVGVEETLASDKLTDYLRQAIEQKRTIHFLPPYRNEHRFRLSKLMGITDPFLTAHVSEELIRNVVAQRSVKDNHEIEEIEKAHAVTAHMHMQAMVRARPGMKEQILAGLIEGIALAGGASVSFPVILSTRGEILHNHSHGNIMQEGDMVVNDSGAESDMHYAADITRTFPVSGKFSDRQKDVYRIVLQSQLEAIDALKPGVPYKDIHLLAARIITQGLKDLGLMQGEVEAAVQEGAHALFFPHGLGHMMGLDVHDMENLGEDYVGYDETVQRSDQFGLAYLRLARELQAGFVLTVEPGIYFIPALIEQWKKDRKHKDFINYKKVEKYLDFGGIRIEDDVLITEEGHRVLGKPIPKEITEVEELCSKG